MLRCEHCGKDDFASAAILEMHVLNYCPAKQVESESQVIAESGERIMIGRLEVPVADPNYYVSSDVMAEIDRVLKLLEVRPQNIAMVGPKGSGKTSLAIQIGALRQSPTFLGNAYSQRSSDDWFGREWVDVKKGGMYYEPSLFVEAIETPGATVILNDFALMQNKSVQNGLNDLLDTGIAWVDQIAHALGRPVRVAERVLIIATWNEGSSYTGNIKLSENILDRFPNRIYMGYPPMSQQVEILIRKTQVSYENAGRLVGYGERLRNLDEPVEMSMRGLLQASLKLMLGAHIRDALYYSVISGLPLDMQTKALAALEAVYTTQEKEDIELRKTEWKAWGDA